MKLDLSARSAGVIFDTKVEDQSYNLLEFVLETPFRDEAQG